MPPSPTAPAAQGSTSQQPPPSGYTRAATAQQIATAIAAILAAAELAILQAIAGAVAALLAGSLLQALITRRLQLAVTSAIMEARAGVAAQLSQASRATREDVQAILAADLGPLARLLPAVPLPSLARLAGDLRNAELTAAESAMTGYHRIALRLARLDGPLRAAAAQSLLDDLAGPGLHAFTGRDGRNWGLSSYAEAAASGAVAQAFTAAQLAAYQDAGIGLVIVVRSSPKPPCPRCAPYVGRVLSLNGETGTVMASDARGNLHSAQVFASVADAVAHGLLHPQCRDSLAPFADGASLSGEIPHGPKWVARQDARYRAEQDKRRHERAMRTARRQRVVALTPQARTKARHLIRHLRGQ
jgi:Phage minor capsid protein 2